MVRTALVIGINQYGSERSLRAPAQDAELMARRLEQDGFWKVIRLPEVTLSNGQRQISREKPVTKDELQGAIENLFYPKTERNIPDAALLYFSGHGVRQEGRRTKGFLATSDVDFQNNWGYSLKDLRELLEDSPIRSQVVWLDCCYSGELLNFEEGNPGEQGQARDRCFIAASQDHEVAYEAVDVPYSELTRSLWQGLNTWENGVSSFDLQQFIDRSFQGKQRALFHTSGNAIPLIPAPQSRTAPAQVICEDNPYQGLLAFEPSTAKFFFGRDTAWQRLLNTLQKRPFAFVVGVSGSGKSSLVRAKLWPHLEAQGYRVLVMKPWSNPMQRLRDKLTETLDGQPVDIGVVETCITEEGVMVALERFPFPKILLLVDQFEEVFTVCTRQEERQQFLQTILEITAHPSRDLMLVATMRADFMGHCGDYQLDGLMNDQMVWVAALSPAELRSVIVEPAAVQGYRMTADLVKEIVREVEADPQCLPLLEFGLQELWNHRDRNRHELTLAHYETMKGLVGAIDRHAEGLFTQQTEQGQAWIRQIFLKLVRFGQESKDTRQREERRILLELGADEPQRREIENLLRVLEGKTGRLLVASEEDGKAIVDLAHEALLEGWQRFAGWRQENRDLRRLVQRVEDAHKEWQRKGEQEGYLLQGGLLAEVREQWESLKAEFANPTRDYFRVSDQREQDQLAAERQRNQELERMLTEIKLREEATQIANLISLRPTPKNAIKAIPAVGTSHQKLNGHILTPVQNNLSTVIAKIHDSNVIHGHSDSVWSVAVSPDGQTIVSGSSDKTIRLWRGNWEAWLAVCCNRLRYHPIFKDPPDDLAREACAVCQRLVWEKKNS